MLIDQDFSSDRTKYIGGSDVAGLLGISPFKSPIDVWMEKTGKKTSEANTLPLRFGSFAETFVANEYAKATGFGLHHDESIFIHPRYAFAGAHVDRFVYANGLDQPANRLLECKTAHPFTSHQWGEAGTDQIPMHYLTQVIWYQIVTGIPQADLAVLFGNNDFRIYAINHDPELEELVLQKAIFFWTEYVQKDIPPPAQSSADCQTLFRRSHPSKTIEADLKTCKAYERLQILVNHQERHETEIELLKTQIMAHMQDAEVLTHQGNTLATWKSPKAGFRLDAKRLEHEEPGIFEKYKVPLQASRRFVLKTKNHLEVSA